MVSSRVLNPSPKRAKRIAESTTPASLALRSGAFLIDYILTLLVLAVPLVIAVYIKRRWFAQTTANVIVTIGYLAAIAMLFFNWVYFYAQNGQSFGKTFIGLRVVRLDGNPIDYKTALLRHIIGYPLSVLSLGLGMLWVIWDSKQQGWHDKIANTIVIKGSPN